MRDEFIYCPYCGSDDIVDSDFEVDEEGDLEVQCETCGWMGDPSELVCKEELK